MKRTPSCLPVICLGLLLAAGCDWFHDDDPARDTTAPTVVSVLPADNAQRVAVGSSLSFTFDEPMDRPTAEGALTSVPPLPAGTFSWTDNTMTFTPATPFPEWIEYSVTVGTGAADLAGNPLASPRLLVFRTDDTTAPTVASTAPDNGALRVAVGAAVSVTFSEAMDHASVEGAFSSVPPLPAGSFSWTDNTVTFTPSSPLSRLSEYVVTVGTGASDPAGNVLAVPREFRWTTELPYSVVNLQSDYGAAWSGPNGVYPSRDGRYVFWGDGPEGAGHLYRVRVSDNASQTIWTNRNFYGNVADDGTNTWTGSYNPYGAAYRIPNGDPSAFAVLAIPAYHSIGLAGNGAGFPVAYFGSSAGDGITFWDGNASAGGTIPGTGGGYVYASAVIGNRVYFPTGYYTTPGIWVVDAVNDPKALEGTLLSGNAAIASAGNVFTDNVHLYVQVGANIRKVDPAGSGAIVATLSPGATLDNPVVLGSSIYGGVRDNKSVYVVDKDTGSSRVVDCASYLPSPTGGTAWDATNDGMWFGPSSSVAGSPRMAWFIPRAVIDAGCP
jgi:hypothetical protein